MIKAILIDDERPALRELEYQLKDVDSIEIVGMFTNPLQGIEEISKLKPSVVFLDIEMPQLRGIDAASKILNIDPLIDVVFITAYNQYAIEAFEVNALDYILKPISKERLHKTIGRIIDRKSHLISEKATSKLIIKTLGNFQVGYDNKNPIKWRSEKTKELFAFLLHNQGREISKDEIIENIFYDLDLKKAVHQLHNGIYYIRKTLQEYGIHNDEISIEGNYMLRIGEIDLDYLTFVKNIGEYRKNISAIESIENLYEGDYLKGEDWKWAQPQRTKLSKHYVELLISLGKKYIFDESFDKAERYLLKAFNEEPYVEEISKLLIELYKSTNRNNNAVKHYMEYEKILINELGIVPDREIQLLIGHMKENT